MHRVLLVPRGAFSSWGCSFPGGGSSQGHPEVPCKCEAPGEASTRASGHPSSNREGAYGPWPPESLLMKEPHGCWLTRNTPSAWLPPSPAASPVLQLPLVPACRRGVDAWLEEGASRPAAALRPHPVTDTPCSNTLKPKGFPDLSSLYLTLKAILGGC